MGVVPDPHHVSGTWTIPLTMQLAPRSSESWSKIPTAVPQLAPRRHLKTIDKAIDIHSPLSFLSFLA